MSLLLDNTRYVLATGIKVIVGPKGNLTVFAGEDELTVDDLPPFPWHDFFSELSRKALPRHELCQALRGRGYVKDFADAVLSALIEHGILVPENGFAAVYRFHRESSFGMFAHPVPPYQYGNRDDAVDADAGGQVITLLEEPLPPRDFAELLHARRSTRSFSGKAIMQRVLGTLLKACYGAQGIDETGTLHRAVPSAGGLYPLRLLLFVQNVRGLKQGIYQYLPLRSGIVPLDEVAYPKSLQDLFRTKGIVYDTCSLVANFIGRIDWNGPKYGERGYRYLLIEAGHAAQNLILAAEAFGLKYIPVGAVDDRLMIQTLHLAEDKELPLYSIVVGA